MKKILIFPLVLLVLAIGLYPLSYLFLDMAAALVGSKPPEIGSSLLWRLSFYVHISCGGLALLSGWSQFFSNLRQSYPKAHRFFGRIYVVAVLISGLSGLGIAFVAEGGMAARLGFMSLAVLWLGTTVKAFTAVRSRQWFEHQRWMMRSFALSCAAVTLRLWLPFFQLVLHMPFIEAYRIIAWLCWIPNLFFVEFLILHRSSVDKAA